MIAKIPSLHILTLPLLVTLSLPLAFLAFLTTTFAASVLLLRVILVYAELAIYLLPHYLLLFLQLPPINELPIAKSVASSRRNSNTPSSSPLRTRRSRRLSSASISSMAPALRGSASATSLPIPRPNPLRDFEGVGGWRLSSNDSDDESTDPWTRINSRLILPAESPTARHRRPSLTGGANPFLTNESSYAVEIGGTNSGTWTPNTKRIRTQGFTTASIAAGDRIAGEASFMNAGGQSMQSTASGNGQGTATSTIASHSGSSVSSKSSGISSELTMKGWNT